MAGRSNTERAGNRVLVVSEYFWPDEAGTGRYLGELVARVAADHPDLSFDVLTSRRLYRSSGERATQRLASRDTLGQVAIRRVRSLRSGADSFARRLLADMAFSVREAAEILVRRYDALLVVTNPPLMPLVAGLAARCRRVPLVYLIHDLYPDVPVALGLWPASSSAVSLMHRVQRSILRSACAVVVLGRCMHDHVIEVYDVPESRIRVIPHWPTAFAAPGPADGGADAAQPPAHASRRPLPPDPFTVLYSGNLGRFQDFDTLLGAAELLRDRPDVHFRIAGDGARRAYVEREITQRGLTNVELTGFVSEAVFAAQLAATALGIVSLEPQLEGIGVPSKSYNLLGAGVPLVAVMSQRAEIARVVAETGCGVRIDHGASDDLARQIGELANDPERWRRMSAAAMDYVEGQGGLGHAAAAYGEVLARCAAAGRSSPTRARRGAARR